MKLKAKLIKTNCIHNKDENIHRYAVRGGKLDKDGEMERERKIERESERMRKS